MAFRAGRECFAIVNFDEHKTPVVGKSMWRGDGCCERDAAEGLDRVSVELLEGARSI